MISLCCPVSVHLTSFFVPEMYREGGERADSVLIAREIDKQNINAEWDRSIRTR